MLFKSKLKTTTGLGLKSTVVKDELNHPVAVGCSSYLLNGL